MDRIFLLSPARCDGRRAQILLNEQASFDLARRIRSPGGAPIAEVFSFLSGLYFRGKIAYARHFARQASGEPGVFVITTDRGLMEPETPVVRDDLLAFAGVDIASGGERFRAPLERDAKRIAATLHPQACVVLLGSIATDKYADVLIDAFGTQLVFPSEFVGRGDMSRGGLLLRCVRADVELDYQSVIGAVRRGSRPPKLDPLA
jgi:hypothetical protein